MARLRYARRPFRLGLSAAFLGMALGLAGPEASVAADKDAQVQRGEPAVYETIPLAEGAVVPVETSLIFSDSARCVEAMNSPIAEPDWFASECVQGGLPQIPE